MTLSGNGSINLGSGILTNNDLVSEISGGTLSVYNQYVGSGGTGAFTQSGGADNIGNNLYLGNNAHDSGAFNLHGTGQLSSANSEYVGYSGSGTFTQSGGINNMAEGLYLAYNTGSFGSYNLSAGGLLQYFSNSPGEFIGYSGSGAFAQVGRDQFGPQPCAGLQLRRQRDVHAYRRRLVRGGHRRRRFRHGHLYAVRRNRKHREPAVRAGQQPGRCRKLHPSGNGRLSSEFEDVGGAGLGNFAQSAGTNSAYFLNVQPGSTYTLSAGDLSVVNEYPSGTFTQTGGVHFASELTLSGSYVLSGGSLTGASENIGPGIFTQTGGTNTEVESDRGSPSREAEFTPLAARA